ncbi:MAG: response regulator [Thermodesulfobacteriota bacterium]|nr:response regulator [Thermodesulfobacteriota bacterium]
MEKEFKILVADRNQNVREFIKRELMAEGYRVGLAKNVQEVLKKVHQTEALDLLILDPDLPGTDKLSLLKELQDRIPALPVVVHSYLTDYTDHTNIFSELAFVEKSGSSIEGLKKMVYEILRKRKTT